MDIVFYLWQLKNYFFGLAGVLVGSLPQLVYLKVKHCIFCTSGYTFLQVKHLFKLAFSFFFSFSVPCVHFVDAIHMLDITKNKNLSCFTSAKQYNCLLFTIAASL